MLSQTVRVLQYCTPKCQYTEVTLSWEYEIQEENHFYETAFHKYPCAMIL
jgi:hypothetical protein